MLRQLPDRADTLIVFGQCYRDWLDQLRRSGEETTGLARLASNQLSRYCDGLTSETLRYPSELVRAEIEIRYLPTLRGPAAERVQRLLDAWEATPNDLAAEAAELNWQRSAQMLLLEKHALAGEWKGAKDAATALGPLELSAAMRLAGLVEESPQADQVIELGRLQSRILQQIDPKIPLSATDQNQLHRWQARALVRTGQLAEAHAILEQLAKQGPDDGAIQEEYALLLAAQGDRDALGQWRRVLGKSRPATDRWYRAKYAIAELHYKMGDRERAAQMIRLLRTLYPDLGGRGSQARFEALLDRCES